MKSPARFAMYLFVGAFLAQAAWSFAVPPFRHIDEFDHAYRAAAVADGQWRAPGDTTPKARGELVIVPEGIVRDAFPECDNFPYTGEGNCSPVEHVGDGKVTVASAASRYNPVYYWLIGTPAKPFDGADALYVMRLATIALCALVVALAGYVTALWARTSWPLVSIAVALTPITMYSNSVPAPNGLEISAGLGVWAAMLGAMTVDRQQRDKFLYAAAAFAVPLAGVRAFGPLWLGLIGVSMVVIATPRGTLHILRENARASIVLVVTAAVTVAASAWWTLSAGGLDLETGEGRNQDALANSAIRIPLWFFQVVAAFPTRNEPAPPIVYAAGGLLVLAFLVLGFRSSSRTLKWGLAVTIALSVLVPLVMEVRAYPTAGNIWQGRYGWPFTVGAVLLCGLALDRKPPVTRFVGPAFVAGWLLFATAQLVSVANVLNTQHRVSPLDGDPRWLLPHLWVVAPLTLAGVAALTYAVHGQRVSSTTPAEGAAETPAGVG